MENENLIKTTQQTTNKFDNTNPDNNLCAINNKLLRVMQAKSKKQKSKTNRSRIKKNDIIIRAKKQNDHEEDCANLKKDEVSNNYKDTRTYYEGTSCQLGTQTNKVWEAADNGKLTQLPIRSLVVKTDVKTKPLPGKLNILIVEPSDGKRQTTQEANKNLKNVNKTCVEATSKFYNHILSGGVELLDVNSSGTIFFENLKKLDIWNETTFKGTSPNMQFIYQEDPTGDMETLSHITTLTEAELPHYQHYESVEDKLSMLVTILSIEYTSEGTEELKLKYLYGLKRENQNSTDLDNNCSNDESNDYMTNYGYITAPLQKSKLTGKLSGKESSEYIFKRDGKVTILNLLTNIVAIVYQLVQSVINLILGKQSCLDLWNQIKPLGNERQDNTGKSPDNSRLVQAATKTWSISENSVVIMMGNQYCYGVEEQKSGWRVSKTDAYIQELDIPKQKITYIAKLRRIMDDVREKDPVIYYNAGTKHRGRQINNQSQEQSRLKMNLTQDLYEYRWVNNTLVALHKSWHDWTLKRLQRKEKLQTNIVTGIPNSLDMNYFLEYQDEPDDGSAVKETNLKLGDLFVNIFIVQAGEPLLVISNEENELVNILVKNLTRIVGIQCMSMYTLNLNSKEFIKNRDDALKVQSYQRIDAWKRNDWDPFQPRVILLYNTTFSLTAGCVLMKLMRERASLMPFFKHIESMVGDSILEIWSNEYVRKLVESNNGYCNFAIKRAKKSKLIFKVQVRQSLRFVDYESVRMILLLRSLVHKFKSTNKMETYTILMKWLKRCEGMCVIKRQCQLWLK